MAEEKAIIYLDFNDKLANDTFEKDAFIRIANLHKKNPLVQINDAVYKGTYDYALGTNLLFDENLENPKKNDIFIKRDEIQYEHVFSTAKIVDLKPVKVPTRKVQVSSDYKKLEFKLDWDYKELLEKFADGTLRLHDILKDGKSYETNNDEQEPRAAEEEMDVVEENDNQADVKVQEIISDAELDNLEDETTQMASMDLLEDYHKLRQLAFRPVKMPAKEEELQSCDSKYKDSYDYNNLECQILQPCDFFRIEPVANINEDTLSNCVDIDRCILYGLIDKSIVNRKKLTNEEKQKLLSLDNFDNLSLAARYYVLKSHVKDLEGYLKNRTDDELSSRDVYGRTPVETLKIYRKMAEAVRKRIEEIKYSAAEEQEANSIEQTDECIEND